MASLRGAALAIALAAAGAGGCARAPAVPQPRAEVLWPALPAPARVRLAAVFPDPAAPRPRRSAWRRVLDFVVGRDAPDPQEWVVRPFGVALAEHAFYVADPDAPAVLRVEGPHVSRVACRGKEWAAPMAIALDADGTLYVADGGSARIVAVEPAGACRALGEGALERPVSVALDGERILVADPPRHQIVVLSRQGEVLARWGRKGTQRGEFHFPTAVARATDGTLLVVDALNFRIVRLTAEGEWLGAFGVPGETGGELAAPKGVATDGAGRVFVSDARRDLVLVFRSDGELDYAIGASGSAPGQLALPAGVAVAGRRVLVADSMNHRVQLFEVLGDPS